MMRKPWTQIPICMAMAVALLALATAARAADDTARFYGTWDAVVVVNGQTVTVVSVHDASGYKAYVRLPSGDSPAGDGTFSAANGKYTTNAEKPNDVGIYHFLGSDTVVCTNAAGQTVIWKREKAVSSSAKPLDANAAARATTGYIPPTDRPGNQTVNPGAPPPASAQRAAGAAPAAALAPDPSLLPETNAAIAAFNQKDYNTAWRDFMAAAQKGDSEAEAGVGAMLFNRLNPPGTGYYAQCEKWLLASANQGNAKGMDFLAQYYYASGVAIAGGINPGVNNAPIPPALQQQAEGKFALARQWFDRASAKGDIYAMGNLAIMLDSGVGGPRDANRAAQLRAQVKGGHDANFAARATADPNNLAITAAWQAGHYADAIKNAQAAAAKGDANGEALLGRAYYEGVGVNRNYAIALTWLNKAVAQNNPDAMFFLGLMLEHGRGVPQDLNRATNLFDRAAALGQRYAAMEVNGMRMQGEVDRQAALAHRGRSVEDTACETAGGIPSPGECMKGGGDIDPFNASEAAGSGYEQPAESGE
jgi:TPR repeat protein